ncbi:MAG: hypothetical protein GXZ15_04410 [Campylobacter sp.]|nr:hypothetical protein [Campylobacter sp.]
MRFLIFFILIFTFPNILFADKMKNNYLNDLAYYYGVNEHRNALILRINDLLQNQTNTPSQNIFYTLSIKDNAIVITLNNKVVKYLKFKDFYDNYKVTYTCDKNKECHIKHNINSDSIFIISSNKKVADELAHTLSYLMENIQNGDKTREDLPQEYTKDLLPFYNLLAFEWDIKKTAEEGLSQASFDKVTNINNNKEYQSLYSAEKKKLSRCATIATDATNFALLAGKAEHGYFISRQMFELSSSEGIGIELAKETGFTLESIPKKGEEVKVKFREIIPTYLKDNNKKDKNKAIFLYSAFATHHGYSNWEKVYDTLVKNSYLKKVYYPSGMEIESVYEENYYTDFIDTLKDIQYKTWEICIQKLPTICNEDNQIKDRQARCLSKYTSDFHPYTYPHFDEVADIYKKAGY